MVDATIDRASMTSHQLGHAHLVLFVSADKHRQSHIIAALLFGEHVCFLRVLGGYSTATTFLLHASAGP